MLIDAADTLQECRISKVDGDPRGLRTPRENAAIDGLGRVPAGRMLRTGGIVRNHAQALRRPRVFRALATTRPSMAKRAGQAYHDDSAMAFTTGTTPERGVRTRTATVAGILAARPMRVAGDADSTARDPARATGKASLQEGAPASILKASGRVCCAARR